MMAIGVSGLLKTTAIWDLQINRSRRYVTKCIVNLYIKLSNVFHSVNTRLINGHHIMQHFDNSTLHGLSTKINQILHSNFDYGWILESVSNIVHAVKREEGRFSSWVKHPVDKDRDVVNHLQKQPSWRYMFIQADFANMRFQRQQSSLYEART
jgi:hypothetical protein